MIDWKVVVTSKDNSDELFLIDLIESGGIPLVDTGTIEEVLTAGIRDVVEGLPAEVDVSKMVEVLARGTAEVETFRSAC